MHPCWFARDPSRFNLFYTTIITGYEPEILHLCIFLLCGLRDNCVALTYKNRLLINTVFSSLKGNKNVNIHVKQRDKSQYISFTSLHYIVWNWNATYSRSSKRYLKHVGCFYWSNRISHHHQLTYLFSLNWSRSSGVAHGGCACKEGGGLEIGKKTYVWGDCEMEAADWDNGWGRRT